MSWLLLSCFFTPSILFRIDPILLLEFQAEQPGTFSCTVLSVARVIEEKATKKKILKKILMNFFILKPHFHY
jgi:hypothetical protein